MTFARPLLVLLVLGMLSSPVAAEDETSATDSSSDGEEEQPQDGDDSAGSDGPASQEGDASEEPSKATAPPRTLPPPEPSHPRVPEVDLTQPTAALYDQGKSDFSEGAFLYAMPYLEEVLRREPDHAQARNYLVECYTILGMAEDASNIRRGGLPAGAATPVAAPELRTLPPSEREPVDPDAKANFINPRRAEQAAFGAGLLGPTLGLGVFVEYRPFWLVGVLGGIGGVATEEHDGILAVFVEGVLMPVPRKLTPIIGVGASTLLGPQARTVDAVSQSVVQEENIRVLPYLLLGVRYDNRSGLFLSGGVGFFPTGADEPPVVLPFPGFRAGIRF